MNENPHGSENRYIPPGTATACDTHPSCYLARCGHYHCDQPIHRRLRGPGRTRQYCSTACRVAEHRRLN